MSATLTSKGVVLALSCTAQFMVVLDIAIVNVALPSIQRALGVAQSTLQWVVIAYGLVLGGFLLLGGRMGDLLGRRRVFVTGLVLFSTASLVAGLAQTAGLLIAARALQGFGAALIAPSALAILAISFPEGVERNRALGIFGAVAGSSASAGVIASGVLTDGPGWRWIFFINVPVGILLTMGALAFLADDRSERKGQRFDIAGATTVTAGLLLLVYALNRGVDYGWGSASTLTLFASAVVLLAIFARLEARSASPLVPGSALRNRTLVAADVMAFLVFGGFFSFIFLGSLLMQQVLGYSPIRTGVSWLATSLTAFVAAGVTGARLATAVGPRKLLMAGMSLLALAGFLLTRLPVGADYASDLLPALLLAGVAIGLCAVSVQISALSGVATSASGLASGLVETMREVGGAVGVAAVATVLVSRAREAGQLADPAARQLTLLEGFQSAFGVIALLAVIGLAVAAVAFPRISRRDEIVVTAEYPAGALGEPATEGTLAG